MSSGRLVPVPSPDDGAQAWGDIEYVLYQVKYLLPETQRLVTVTPETVVREALSLMKHHGYSQVPVVQHDAVLGVFSHRSFSDGVLELAGESRLRPEELPVIDFVDELGFAELETDIADLLAELDVDNAVLIGSPQRLVGIATTMDALRFFYRAATAFLLVQEIERGIRILLAAALSADDLGNAMNRCKLEVVNRTGGAPSTLEDLSFGDYLQLIGNKENWVDLEPVFGTSRELVMTKLRPVQQLRNDAFHFRRELTDTDRERLRSVRRWLRIRLRLCQSGGSGG
jgi:CBS domain-containing protein